MRSPKRQRLRMTFAAVIVLMLAGCEQALELGPGIRAPEAPLQRASDGERFEHRGFLLEPQAEFAVTGKLLARRRYRWDRLAALAPWDFAMGWDLMSDETFLEWVDFTQGDRFLFRKLLHPKLPLRRIERSSANIHLIPADAAIGAQLASVPVGSIVTLAGTLVNAHDSETTTRFLTSLSRDDVGAGACEILFLEHLEIRP